MSVAIFTHHPPRGRWRTWYARRARPFAGSEHALCRSWTHLFCASDAIAVELRSKGLTQVIPETYPSMSSSVLRVPVDHDHQLRARWEIERSRERTHGPPRAVGRTRARLEVDPQLRHVEEELTGLGLVASRELHELLRDGVLDEDEGAPLEIAVDEILQGPLEGDGEIAERGRDASHGVES